jgi:hypothetical protein
MVAATIVKPGKPVAALPLVPEVIRNGMNGGNGSIGIIWCTGTVG